MRPSATNPAPFARRDRTGDTASEDQNGSSGEVKILKSIQGARKKRSILCLVESSRPIPNLFKNSA